MVSKLNAFPTHEQLTKNLTYMLVTFPSTASINFILKKYEGIKCKYWYLHGVQVPVPDRDGGTTVFLYGVNFEMK